MAEATLRSYVTLQASVDLAMGCQGFTIERMTKIVKAAGTILHQDDNVPAFRDFCRTLLDTLAREDTPDECIAEIQAAILTELDKSLDEIVN